MKEYIVQLIGGAASTLQGRLLVREYLQARILELLQNQNAFQHLLFLGGTALRFLYALPRFSEDLDFSKVMSETELDLTKTSEKLCRRFDAEGYQVVFKVREGLVASSSIRFTGLLFELGLSAHKGEVISIKIEIDTNPPSGAKTESTLIRRHVLLNLHHHDRSSLFAGKLHAILSRKFTKGRDVYDLLWYLSDPSWPEPNIELLNSALLQTSWQGPPLEDQSWRHVLAARLEEIDWASAVRDVRPFLEKESETALLTRDNLLQLIERQ